jgi:hypothetical protein
MASVVALLAGKGRGLVVTNHNPGWPVVGVYLWSEVVQYGK